jgi:hypothetical protein
MKPSVTDTLNTAYQLFNFLLFILRITLLMALNYLLGCSMHSKNCLTCYDELYARHLLYTNTTTFMFNLL